MSFTIDANILIFGANTRAREHPAARQALDGAWRGSERVVLFWPAVIAFLRVVTVPGVFSRPVTLPEALGSIDRVLSLPHVQLVADTGGGWSVLRDVALGRPAIGKLVHDAHIVALMRQHGVSTVWTHDSDFDRFDGVRVYDPVTGFRAG